MARILAAIFGILAIYAPAFAEPISLSNAELLDLQAGLRDLAGTHPVIVKVGGQDTVANVPFKLKAAVVDQIAQNILALKPVNDAMDMTRNNLQQQAAIDDAGHPREAAAKAEEMRKAEDGFRKLLLEKRTVELVRIDPKELGREEPANNPISALTMAQLAPIMGDKK